MPKINKKGFGKTGWRTFMVSRMSDLRVSDESIIFMLIARKESQRRRERAI
mgnify:CR=1 FL=1